ncbi:hypothetical protein [Rhizobium lusitanum]|uniref:non-homologous end-joining DNA ligase LigD n=1 Tax=Rhizobium lusitanum TaxID=293958 RepID=UPI0032B18C0F
MASFPFVKTSGGKGLHIACPLVAKAEWPAVKAFTKGIADAMATDSPERYVSTITKSKHRGKILIDYLRNQRGSTAVAPLFDPCVQRLPFRCPYPGRN